MNRERIARRESPNSANKTTQQRAVVDRRRCCFATLCLVLVVSCVLYSWGNRPWEKSALGGSVLCQARTRSSLAQKQSTMQFPVKFRWYYFVLSRFDARICACLPTCFFFFFGRPRKCINNVQILVRRSGFHVMRLKYEIFIPTSCRRNNRFNSFQFNFHSKGVLIMVFN